MELLRHLFTLEPLLALFATIAIGYLVGKIKIGSFVLGGIAGTLLVGVVIGQLGINIDSGIKAIFFALFIYAVGFQGGPQFFHALNRRSLNQLASSFVMCFTGLLCVLLAAWMFGLDRGMAAGLAAGGLTQSAILGTAGDAIAKLGLSPALIKTMQTNVAVGYAVCYIFGSLGPIIMVSWFLPMVMKWDIRQEAVKLAKLMSGGRAELDPGQFNAVRDIDTRIYEIAQTSKAVGETALAIDKKLSDAAVEAIFRDGKALDFTDATIAQAGDSVAITGTIDVMETASDFFGREVTAPTGLLLVQENREIILTNRALSGRELGEIHDHVNVDTRHGVFLTAVKRMGRDLPLLSKLQLKSGDELHFTGSPTDLNRVQSKIGYKITAAASHRFHLLRHRYAHRHAHRLDSVQDMGCSDLNRQRRRLSAVGLVLRLVAQCASEILGVTARRVQLPPRFRTGRFCRNCRYHRRSPSPGRHSAIRHDAILSRGRGDADSADHHILLLLLHPTHPEPN